jgi:hypothetical protein
LPIRPFWVGASAILPFIYSVGRCDRSEHRRRLPTRQLTLGPRRDRLTLKIYLCAPPIHTFLVHFGYPRNAAPSRRRSKSLVGWLALQKQRNTKPTYPVRRTQNVTCITACL